MANGLGGFANLTPAQRQLVDSRRNVDPLTALIQGFQQGQAIQQLPEQIEQQRIAQQLALQLQQGRLAQQGLQLEAMRRAVPTELERAVQQAAQVAQARQLGVFTAPQIIGRPAALPAVPLSTAAQRTLAATPEDALFVEEVVSPLEVPIQVGAGAVFDPVVARETQQQAAEQKRLEAERKLRSEEGIKQEFELERIEARNRSRGFKTYVNPADPTDFRTLDPTERPPEGFMDVKDYFRKGGPGNPAGPGGRGAGLKPSAEAVNQFNQGRGVLQQIDETLKIAEKFQKEGKFPNALEVGLDEFLGRRPQDIPGAGAIPGLASAFSTIQNLAKGLQTKEAAAIQRKKAIIGATIIRQQAGLSQTLGEAINISPYTPSPSDTYEVLIGKLKDLRTEGQRALRIQREAFPDLAAINAPELGEGKAPPPTGGRSFATEAEARAAGFQNDDLVIINGQPGRLK